MRRIISLLLALFALFSMVACGDSGEPANSPTNNSGTTTAADSSTTKSASTTEEVTADSVNATADTSLVESGIRFLVSGKIPYKTLNAVSVSGLINIEIDLSTTAKIQEFGNYIVEAKEAISKGISSSERGAITITLYDSNNNKMLVFKDSKASYGTIHDYRSGTEIKKIIASQDELANEYPALKTYLSERNLNKNDVAMYNEVMKILQSDWSRSEDEIIKEIAPNYGMTASELKKFLNEMQRKIFD